MKKIPKLCVSFIVGGLLVLCALNGALAGSLDRGTMQERYNSAAKDMLRVPGVVGSYEQEALGLLQQSGLAVQIKRLTKETPQYAGQEGQVVRQVPSSGGIAMIGSTITLTIYKKYTSAEEGYYDSPSEPWGEAEPSSDRWGATDSESSWDGAPAGEAGEGAPEYDGSWSGDTGGGGWSPPPPEPEEEPPAPPSRTEPEVTTTDDSSRSFDGAEKPVGRNKKGPSPAVSRSNPAAAIGGSAPPAKSASGGFVLPGVSGVAEQVRGRNALSAQKLREIVEKSREFTNFKRQMAASERRVQERMRAMTEEAYLSGADCDDTDAEIAPGRTEICDHKDNDCDGVIDEDVGTYKFADVDGDTHGDPDTMMKVCPADIAEALRSGHWLVDAGNDCDDQDPNHWNDCSPTGAR